MDDLAAGMTVSSGSLAATFLPELGMLGVSLRHLGEELLDLPGGLDGYRAGAVTGLPLLAPWANRLGERRYEVDGVAVDLEGLALHADDHGLPIHGTMSAQPGWEVVERTERSLTTRFDYGARPELLASFPFPHELRIQIDVDEATLRSATTMVATTDRAVPVAFGYHPYLVLPGVQREDVRLRLPARRHLLLDDRGLPTGAARTEDAEDARLGSRTFDDLYQLDDDRRFELTGGGRRLVLECGEGYPFAQVFTPDSANSVCLEPMTAAVNSLVDGSCALVPPEETFTARFSLRVELTD
ncbi:MAG: aldose 1-epimerase [Acidimicrobiales bacterium]